MKVEFLLKRVERLEEKTEKLQDQSNQLKDCIHKFGNRVNGTIGENSERLASVESTIDQFQINIKRFYEKDMGPLLDSVKDISKNVNKITVDLAETKTKIAIYGTLAAFLSSALTTLLIKLVT